MPYRMCNDINMLMGAARGGAGKAGNFRRRKASARQALPGAGGRGASHGRSPPLARIRRRLSDHACGGAGALSISRAAPRNTAPKTRASRVSGPPPTSDKSSASRISK